MGIFDRIKETYRKVDTKLGGYLPGAVKPSEVKASKAVATPVATPAEIIGRTPLNSKGQTSASGLPEIPESTKSSLPIQQTDNPKMDYSFTPEEHAQNNAAAGAAAEAGVPYTAPEPVGRIRTEPLPTYHEQYGRYEYKIGQDGWAEERLINMGNVMKTSANPFDKEHIRSTTSSNFVNKVLEAGANNPYDTALISVTGINLVKKAYTTIKSAGSLGKTIETGKIGQYAKTGWTTLKTKSVGQIVLDAAKLIDANKAWILAGFGIFSMGVGAAFMNARNQAQVFNDLGDLSQSFSITLGNLVDIGDEEGAEEMRQLIYDTDTLLETLDNKDDGLFKNMKDVYIAGRDKVKLLAEQTRISSEANERKKAKDIVNDALKNKIENGDASDAEKEAYLKENPNDYGIKDILKDEATTGVEDAGLAAGDALVSRIFTEGLDGGLMSDEQLINDPAIRAFVLDSRNQFGAVKKIYDQALARYVAAGGTIQGGSGTIGSIEPASTLGFGLLSTGSQYKEGVGATEGVDTEEATPISVESRREIADWFTSNNSPMSERLDVIALITFSEHYEELDQSQQQYTQQLEATFE